MRSVRVGSARVRRRLPGRRRPHRGVLAVDPDRRATGVLVGLTLLALLVAGTGSVLGVVHLLADDGPPSTTSTVQDAAVQGRAACSGNQASGTWTLPYDAEQALHVALLADDGRQLAAGPVAGDGTWTLPLRAPLAGTAAVVLVQQGFGALATGQLEGC